MASTHSPTFKRPGAAKVTLGKSLASTFSNAMSDRLSAPMTFALNSLRSSRRTSTSSAPSTT